MNSVAFPPEIEPQIAAPKPQSAASDAPKLRAPARQPGAPASVPSAAPTKPDRSFALVMVSTTVSILAAFAIGRSGWFTAGDNIGYYIGLVGGVLMLLLLLYPLRKHVAALRNWGKVKNWFAVHMVLGICGPILVLAHSTFHMRSTNASVALICMLVVAASGIVGRFLYTKVHRGLYGEKLNLKDLQAQTGLESSQIRSRLHFAPAVERRLSEFQALALGKSTDIGSDALRFLSLGARRYAAYRACVQDLKAVMDAAAQARGWDRAKRKGQLRAATDLVDEYLGAAQRVAEFRIYDRLLQLWHVAHVPLVYLLAISAIAHVVAVHMY